LSKWASGQAAGLRCLPRRRRERKQILHILAAAPAYNDKEVVRKNPEEKGLAMGSFSLSTTFLLLLVSLAGWAGGLLVLLRASWSQRCLYAWVSGGAGLLTALTILELLPRSMAHGHTSYMAVVLAGFLLFFGTDTLFQHGKRQEVPIAGLVTGLLIHSLLEGMSLAASFHLDRSLGLALLVAMLLHKLPDGITIASLLLISGNRRKALAGSGGLGLATLAGGWSMLAAGEWLTAERLQLVFALTTGFFLYLALCHLVPFVLKSKETRFQLSFLAGILLYLLLLLVFPLHPHV